MGTDVGSVQNEKVNSNAPGLLKHMFHEKYLTKRNIWRGPPVKNSIINHCRGILSVIFSPSLCCCSCYKAASVLEQYYILSYGLRWWRRHKDTQTHTHTPSKALFPPNMILLVSKVWIFQLQSTSIIAIYACVQPFTVVSLYFGYSYVHTYASNIESSQE